MKKIKRTIIAAVLVSKDKKVLLGRMRKGGVYPGCWHIPGGGVDEGESQQQALNREIEEEVGLDISQLEPVLLDDTDTDVAEKVDRRSGERYLVAMVFHQYRVDLSDTASEIRVKLNDDLVGYEWVSIDDLGNYRHTPPSEKLFKSLGWLK